MGRILRNDQVMLLNSRDLYQFMHLLRNKNRSGARIILNLDPYLGKAALYKSLIDHDYDILVDLINNYHIVPDIQVLEGVSSDYQTGKLQSSKVLIYILEKLNSVEGERINRALGKISTVLKVRFAALARHKGLYMHLVAGLKEITPFRALRIAAGSGVFNFLELTEPDLLPFHYI